MVRPWDPTGTYQEAVLKEYQHWILEVSPRQHTLGSYLICAKRELERFSELSPEELVELIKVMKEIERALEKNPLFKPDRFNYWQLGNAYKMLRFWGMPRYASPREFNNKTWIDTNWGHAAIWSKEDITPQLAEEIKEEIERYL